MMIIFIHKTAVEQRPYTISELAPNYHTVSDEKNFGKSNATENWAIEVFKLACLIVLT